MRASAHRNFWVSSSPSPSLPCRLSFPLVHLPGMFHVEQRRMSEGGNLARASEWSRHQDWHPSERGSWRLAGSNGALEVRVQAHAPPGLSDWSTRHRSRAVSRRAECGSTPPFLPAGDEKERQEPAAESPACGWSGRALCRRSTGPDRPPTVQLVPTRCLECNRPMDDRVRRVRRPWRKEQAASV